MAKLRPGDGRTYIGAFLMGLVPVLATSAGAVTGAVTDAAAKARTTLFDKVFAADRVISSKRLTWLMVFPVVVLVLVARRHILHQ